MDSKLIIKYFEDRCNQEEELIVMHWVNESEENMEYFIKMKNIHTMTTMPDEPATNIELNQFNTKCLNGKGSNKFGVRYFYVSAAASIIILLALNLHFNWIDKNDPEKSIVAIADLPLEQKDTLYSEKGVKAKILLPDGSKVWLNSDTKIIFPKKFSGKSREVILIGEAYFEVMKDSLHPMIVRTSKNFRIEVLGTKFNIKSYEDDISARTTLYSGSIRLVTQNRGKEVYTKLNPNESVLIKDNSVVYLNKKEEGSNETAWKNGDLIFDSVKFSDAVKILERWHGVKITVKNPALLNETISANFHSESIIQIMELLKFSLKLDYEKTEDQLVIK